MGSLKDTLKNTRLGRWIETGETPLPDLGLGLQNPMEVLRAQLGAKTAADQDLVVVESDKLRPLIGSTIKGGVVTGVGLTVLAAGLARTLLSPSGIVGTAMIAAGGVTTVFFGGKTLKDYWMVNKALRK